MKNRSIKFQYAPKEFRLRLYFLFGVLLIIGVGISGYLLLRVPEILALNRAPHDIFDNSEREVLVQCTPIVKVSMIESVTFNGLPIIGNTIELDASRVKLFSQIAVLTPNLFNPSCESFNSGLNEGSIEWELLSKPTGSAATIENSTSLKANIRLNQPGQYKVKFTACEDGTCELALNDNIMVAQPASKILTIDALSEIALPPDTEPAVPRMAPVPKTPISKEGLCGTWPDVLSAAWYTVEPWNGPGDYKLLEGLVRESRSSTTDNNLNHDIPDFIFMTEPDPPFGYLLPAGSNQNLIEVEWERYSFHPLARPTRGDRVSVVGYWINDCAHDGRTEIHPPVMVAAHRARPIRLPESEGLGSNIYIAGISSTVSIDRDAGETTRNCSTTGLHESRKVFRTLQDGNVAHNCLPNQKGYSGNPIDTVFTYNIYLPRNPREVYADIDREVPAAELFTKIYYPMGSAGPDPVLTENVTDDGITYLEVRIDLRNFTGRTYGRRIEAGWVYPSADNWSLKRWRVQVNSLDVHDDMDTDINPFTDNPGDWRLWINTNNNSQEWTMILDESCSDCIPEGNVDFNATPWTTGDASFTHSLGQDLLLFPQRLIWVHSSGYEDEYYEDNLGKVNRLLPQKDSTYSHRCDKDVYTLNYQVSAGPAVGEANLSFLGRQVYDRFVIRPQPGRPTFPNFEVAYRDWNHPDALQLPPGTPPFNLADSNFFHEQVTEPLSIEGISDAEFQKRLAEAQEEAPDELRTAMAELREEVDLMLQRPDDPDVYLNLKLLKNAMPVDVWKQHFGDIDLEELLPDSPPKLIPLWWLILAVLVTAVVLILLFLLGYPAWRGK